MYLPLNESSSRGEGVETERLYTKMIFYIPTERCLGLVLFALSLDVALVMHASVLRVELE